MARNLPSTHIFRADFFINGEDTPEFSFECRSHLKLAVIIGRHFSSVHKMVLSSRMVGRSEANLGEALRESGS